MTRKAEKRRLSRKVKAAEGLRHIDVDLLKRLLLSDLNTADMPLTSDMSSQLAARVLLARNAFKKFEAGRASDAGTKAIAKFLEKNEACSAFRLVCSRELDALVDGLVKDEIHRLVLPDWDSSISLSEISEGFDVGPGSSVGSEEDDFLSKVFHSQLTTTRPGLRPLYVHALRSPTWRAAEQRRHAEYGLAIVEGGEVLTVRKYTHIDRTIEKQPILEMLFQKGVALVLERRLRRSYGIDLASQPDRNRRLALAGSKGQDFCTIDLESASDCISVSLCEQILPRQLLSWLMLSRCDSTILPDGTKVRLSMMSSMGNAFTFPLQTLIFGAVVVACYRALDIKPSRCDAARPNWGVFGDDIIVCRKAYDLVTTTLARYGFCVNDNKSFFSGSFRESCGGDFWNGTNIRSVYIKKLTTVSHVYSVLNRLIRWSAVHAWPLDFTVSYLISRVRVLLLIPYCEDDSGGLKVSFEHWHLKSGYFSIATRSPLFRELVKRGRSYPLPDSDKHWKVGKGHSRSYNGCGILISLLRGSVRDGRVGLRDKTDHPSFKVVWRSVPYWDWQPDADDYPRRGIEWKLYSDRYLILSGI